jgi:protein-L-isoaspartate O-methyltransferase
MSTHLREIKFKMLRHFSSHHPCLPTCTYGTVAHPIITPLHTRCRCNAQLNAMATSQLTLVTVLLFLVLEAGYSFAPQQSIGPSLWVSRPRHYSYRRWSPAVNKEEQHHHLLTATIGFGEETLLSMDERLHLSLSVKDNETIVVEGYVSAKRAFGSALAFVDLLLHTMSDSTNDYSNVDICQALLRREHYDHDTCSRYEGYRRCLLPGTLLRLEGVAAPTRSPGEAVLLVQRINLIQVPRQPQHIAAMLALAVSDDLPMREVAKASHVSDVASFEESLRERSEQANGGTYKTYRSVAKALCSELPPLPKEVEDHMGNQRPPVPTHLVHPPTSVLSSLSKDSSFITSETLSVDAAKELFGASSTSTVVSVMGVVQNRRRFQENVTIINLVDDITPLSKDTEDVGVVDLRRLESILHPDLLDVSDMYGNLLTVGSQVWVSGILVQKNENAATGNNRSSSAVLWVTQARLARTSWRPMTIRYVLDLLYGGELDVDEAAEALQVTLAEAQQFAEMDDLTARQWKANELSVKLQTSTSRMSNLAPEVLNVLDQYEHLRTKWPLQPPKLTPLVATAVPSPDDARPVTTTQLPQSLPGSKWQRKKRPQLEWMVQEICNVAKSHPEFGKRTLHILDIGGGKGKLANYLAQSLGPELVQVHVVDIAAGAIANGAMRAKRLKVENVQYQVADASQFIPEKQGMDMVVALHACGHLSDVALAHAVQNKAHGFVICPCCFSSNLFLRVPASARDSKQTRQMSVEEFLDIAPLAWTALKSVAEVQGDATLASQGIHTICAVRAEAVAKQLESSDNVKEMQIEIKSFPIQYSTRNICLVGANQKKSFVEYTDKDFSRSQEST